MSPQEILARKLNLSSTEQKTSTYAPSYDFDKAVRSTQSFIESHLSSIKNDIETDQETLSTTNIATTNPSTILRWFTVTDILILALGYLIAGSLAELINVSFLDRPFSNGLAFDSLNLWRFAFIAVCSLLWFEHTGHYRIRMPFWQEALKIVSVFGVAMATDGFMQFTSKNDFSRIWLISSWVISAGLLIAARHFARRTLHRMGFWKVRTLLVGDGSTAEEARKILSNERSLGYEICAQIENAPMLLSAQAQNSWRALCKRHEAGYVFIALNGVALAEFTPALHQLMREGVPFSILSPHRQLPTTEMVAQSFYNRDVTLLTRSSGLEQPLPRFFKRCIDVIGAVCALTILSPLLLSVALMIRKDGGPALFGHRRIGMNGKTFPCLKFRSMVPNAEETLQEHLAANTEAYSEWTKDHKLRHDPRVTKIGSLLRKTSLDELPQLINVLKGDMSLVGPRPIVAAEIQKYGQVIGDYYLVRPGITGLWQVNGRNDVTYERRVQLDSWYVRNWSLWHDIAILFKTIPVLLKGTGAY